jgi:hypothetical protein
MFWSVLIILGSVDSLMVQKLGSHETHIGRETPDVVDLPLQQSHVFSTRLFGMVILGSVINTLGETDIQVLVVLACFFRTDFVVVLLLTLIPVLEQLTRAERRGDVVLTVLAVHIGDQTIRVVVVGHGGSVRRDLKEEGKLGGNQYKSERLFCVDFQIMRI